MSRFPSLKSFAVSFRLKFPADMYVTFRLLLFRLKISLILFTPSSDRHFIVTVYFNSTSFFFFWVVFLICSMCFCGMCFLSSSGDSFDSLMNVKRSG